MRLDVYLYQNGFAPSRQKAKELIENGQVLLDGKVASRASYAVLPESTPVITLQGRVLPYVSRGGLKLEAALDAFSLDVKGLCAVDIGASTGGFTDCLLQRGAKCVYAVDCGTDQLHPTLRKDPRVVVLEQQNAKLLGAEHIGGPCDLVVMDVSFISQTQLYPAVCRVLKPQGHFVSLIKPQFEAGKQALSKRGIVTEEKVRRACVESVLEQATLCGLQPIGQMLSPITGGDGNVEYLAHFIYTEPKEEKPKEVFF